MNTTSFQKRLLQSSHEWYPELTEVPSISIVDKKALRWSNHFIYRIDGGKDDTRHLLIKVLKDESKNNRVQNAEVRPPQSSKLEYDALSFIYQWISKEQVDGITAVRPLAYYPDINALALEYLPGRHFLSILLQSGFILSSLKMSRDLKQTANNTGRLLGVIHSIPIETLPNRRVFDREKYLARFHQAARTLSVLDGTDLVAEQIANTQRAIENHLLFADQEVVFSHLHGDYYPENIVQLPDGRVFTIDTTLHQVGPVEQDIAKFLIGTEITKRHLLFGSVGMRGTVPIRVNQAFLIGYRSVGKYNPKILLAFHFLALLQRWIEVLEVMEGQLPFVLGILLKKTRITPTMLTSLKFLREKIEIETIT